jgi:hypothetical protein
MKLMNYTKLYKRIQIGKFSKQNPSSETNNHAASHKILHLLWNPKVSYHVHESQSLVPTLSQINLLHPPTLLL